MIDEVNEQARGGVSSERRIECLEVLMRRFGIDSALVGVPKLARALGMGASTLYAYMRAGTLFVPYRMVNGTPMVKVDDLIDWYLSEECDVRPAVAAVGAQAKPSLALQSSSEAPSRQEPSSAKHGSKCLADRAEVGRSVEFEPRDVMSQEAADRAVDGLVASVKARMERQRSQPPRAGA